MEYKELFSLSKEDRVAWLDSKVKLLTRTLKDVGVNAVSDHDSVYFIPHSKSVHSALTAFPLRYIEEDQNYREHHLVFINVASFKWDDSKHSAEILWKKMEEEGCTI